tara:strand:- start:446 stop:679 length:234 start_codon:yes stop_codon:yes gene_type:complete
MNKTEAIKKGVETMKMNEDAKNLQNKPKEPKDKNLSPEEIQTSIDNLRSQWNQYNTMAIKAQGAIEVLTAMLPKQGE